MAENIHHITSEDEWREALAVGEYRSKDFGIELFIHCSYAHQLMAVADRLFRGKKDLLLLVIDLSKLNCNVVDENLEGGTELYPHVYGPLPLEAVVAVLPLPSKHDGGFMLPCGLEPFRGLNAARFGRRRLGTLYWYSKGFGLRPSIPLMLKTRFYALLILIVGIVSCDQATKRLAISHLRDAPRQTYLQDTIRFEYAENEGAFLGLGNAWNESVRFGLFVVGNGVLLSWIGLWMWRHRTAPSGQLIGLALIWGGGVSNFADRIFSDGRVVDFLNMGIGSVRTGIFNVADVAIMAGMGLLIVDWARNTKRVD